MNTEQRGKSKRVPPNTEKIRKRAYEPPYCLTKGKRGKKEKKTILTAGPQIGVFRKEVAESPRHVKESNCGGRQTFTERAKRSKPNAPGFRGYEHDSSLVGGEDLVGIGKKAQKGRPRTLNWILGQWHSTGKKAQDLGFRTWSGD